jgi:signal transduction histidine kinase
MLGSVASLYVVGLGTEGEGLMPGELDMGQTAQALAYDIAERLWLASKLKVLSPKRAFSMNDAVDVSLFLTDKLFKGAGVTVRASLSHGLAEVDAHMGHVEQALVNVLVNACEASTRGGAVEVATRYVSADRSIEVEIKDTGVGIPADAIERVFEPFFSTKGRMGMGLSAARELMTKSGGEIRIESNVGGGTKVLLRLPAKVS